MNVNRGHRVNRAVRILRACCMHPDTLVSCGAVELYKHKQECANRNKITSQTATSHVHIVTGILLNSAKQNY